MPHTTRRFFLQLAAVTVPVAAVLGRRTASAASGVSDYFPAQPRELVEEMIVVAHGNVARVKELVGGQPTLAKATFDWGFGDWETALGAASHVGNREIAELLLANGAHPTMFSAAMLGQIDVVKTFVAASPGIQRTRGPHSISLMRHATAGGPKAAAVVEYLKSIDGADDKVATQPLTAEEIAKLAGVYTFGVAASDKLEVTVSSGALQIGRPGRFARGLMHIGSWTFCPVGAENVRIAFAETTGAITVTVRDPDPIVTARKPVKVD
ncbi:MAG TPA: hypothetical protein VGY57_05210 [Vicinamibacterales bacterium]|jgi:hypothetical protein|nr:hypothetical protein [Vicinamibacterales bacterium]